MTTTGWQCPVCSRCYAPSVVMCAACDPDRYVTATSAVVALACRLCGKTPGKLIDGLCPESCYGRPA